MPLDLPAVAVAVGDPEQLHQGNDTATAPGSPHVEQSPCRSIFPPWPWPSVIRSSSTQGAGTATSPGLPEVASHISPMGSRSSSSRS